MGKWKDTARATREIIKQKLFGENIIVAEGALLVIEKELPEDQYEVSNINPNSRDGRHFIIKKEDIIFEDYSITRDIHIPMLLMDGWDAQDLLKKMD